MKSLNYPTKEQIEAVIYSAVLDVENGLYENDSHVTIKFYHGDNKQLTCSMTVLKERLTDHNTTKKLFKDICSTFIENKKTTSKKDTYLHSDAVATSNKYTKVIVWLDNNQDNEFVRSSAMFLFNYDDSWYAKSAKEIERSQLLTTSEKTFKLDELKNKLSNYKAERFRCKAVVDDFYSKMMDKK
jgi:hypothetical protein